jgi:antitoxin component of RelBE/YafQ-DinJ toxin-antitoxin module
MAKLTLSVDDQAIKMAKNWAKIQGLSVSQMVSIFFLSVTRSKQAPDEITPKKGPSKSIMTISRESICENCAY